MVHLQYTLCSRKCSYIALFYDIIGLLYCTDSLCTQIIIDQHYSICSAFPWYHTWHLNSMLLTYNKIEGFKSIVVMFPFFSFLNCISVQYLIFFLYLRHHSEVNITLYIKIYFWRSEEVKEGEKVLNNLTFSYHLKKGKHISISYWRQMPGLSLLAS